MNKDNKDLNELVESNEIYRDVYESQTSASGDFDENGGDM